DRSRLRRVRPPARLSRYRRPRRVNATMDQGWVPTRTSTTWSTQASRPTHATSLGEWLLSSALTNPHRSAPSHRDSLAPVRKGGRELARGTQESDWTRGSCGGGGRALSAGGPGAGPARA